MPGDERWFEETGDELRDSEFPDENDFDDDSGLTAACPDCGAEVYEDAVRCPVCGSYVTYGTNVFSGRPTWWIVLGLLGILAVVAVLALYSTW